MNNTLRFHQWKRRLKNDERAQVLLFVFFSLVGIISLLSLFLYIK